MDQRRSTKVVNAFACGVLVLVIAGLLVATWMPAIVAARQKPVAAASQPASQPATAPSTAPANDEPGA